MNILKRLNSSVITFLLLLIFSCDSPDHSKSGVESAMNYYDHLIQKLDADSIALLYTPDGNLGDMVIGRDSIRSFLSSFKNVQVLSQKSTTQSIQIVKDTAIQKGTYVQTDVMSGKDTVVVKGEFIAHWLWLPPNGWHIKKMETKPIK